MSGDKLLEELFNGKPELKEGRVYLTDPNSAYNRFKELSENGRKGLCMSTYSPSEIETDHGIRESTWLTNIPGKKNIERKALNTITKHVGGFVTENPESIVLLDGFEDMVTERDFKSALGCIKNIYEMVAENKSIFLLPVDPNCLKKEEYAQLQRHYESI
jgi:hypothetical protein